MSSPSDQSSYQVRFDWGAAGSDRVVGDSDVVVLVDVLETDDPPALSRGAARVVAGGLRNRRAVAEWVLARQAEKGDRFRVAVIAAGASPGAIGGEAGFAVEDLLAAGAVIDALADLGIDHSSPEAAAAGAAFAGLKNAVRHLVSASAAGRALAHAGRGDEVARATQLDSSTDVPALA